MLLGATVSVSVALPVPFVSDSDSQSTPISIFHSVSQAIVSVCSPPSFPKLNDCGETSKKCGSGVAS